MIIITLSRKPVNGSIAENALKWGTGGMNIDASRIGTGEGGKKPVYIPNMKNQIYGLGLGGGAWDNVLGRWPTNLILDEKDGILIRFPQVLSPAAYVQKTTVKGVVYKLGSLENKTDNLSTHHGDSGSAARFFKQVRG
jgi:hypothetical protein